MTISLDPLLSIPPTQNTASAASSTSSSVSFGALLESQLTAVGSQAFSSSQTDSAGIYSDSMYSQMASLFGSLESEDNLKSALMMFCMMMGTGAPSSALGAAMTSLSAALSSRSGSQLENLRYDMLTSGYNPSVLMRANNALFSASVSEAVTPFDASKAVTPAVTSMPGSRSAALYRSVINQFAVETNPRYTVNKKGDNDTYCNIFMWDVTRAMNAEIPHYVDPETLEARQYPDTKGARELNANGIYDWLAEKGSDYGWVRVSPEQAQMYANSGMPVVTAWKNTDGGHGHVQVVCPSMDNIYDPTRGVTIAQAGRRLMNYAPITDVYNERLKDVVYYAHV